MGIAIVLAASAASEEQLKEKGFEKKEVWIKYSSASKEEAEHELFNMRNPPFMFLAGSWWGADPD